LIVRDLALIGEDADRSHVCSGSTADVTLLNFDVRFTPESRHSPTRSGCLLWAISGLMHCSNERCYSITSSAEAIRPDAIVRPNALAVLRLMVIV